MFKEADKIQIQFKAAGDAPIMKNNRIKLGSHLKFIAIHNYLRESLKEVLKENDHLVLYSNIVPILQ
jgi:hypothetical protein